MRNKLVWRKADKNKKIHKVILKREHGTGHQVGLTPSPEAVIVMIRRLRVTRRPVEGP